VELGLLLFEFSTLANAFGALPNAQRSRAGSMTQFRRTRKEDKKRNARLLGSGVAARVYCADATERNPPDQGGRWRVELPVFPKQSKQFLYCVLDF